MVQVKDQPKGGVNGWYDGECNYHAGSPPLSLLKKLYPKWGGNKVRSMEEFQKRYLPKEVGKNCPYCGRVMFRDD